MFASRTACQQSFVEPFQRLLLHPVAGSLDEADTFHARAGGGSHAVDRAGLAVGAPVVVIHDVPKDSWGYGGLTQEHRATQRETA